MTDQKIHPAESADVCNDKPKPKQTNKRGQRPATCFYKEAQSHFLFLPLPLWHWVTESQGVAAAAAAAVETCPGEMGHPFKKELRHQWTLTRCCRAASARNGRAMVHSKGLFHPNNSLKKESRDSTPERECAKRRSKRSWARARMGLSQKSWETAGMPHTTTGAQLRLWLHEPKSDDEVCIFYF